MWINVNSSGILDEEYLGFDTKYQKSLKKIWIKWAFQILSVFNKGQNLQSKTKYFIGTLKFKGPSLSMKTAHNYLCCSSVSTRLPQSWGFTAAVAVTGSETRCSSLLRARWNLPQELLTLMQMAQTGECSAFWECQAKPFLLLCCGYYTLDFKKSIL